MEPPLTTVKLILRDKLKLKLGVPDDVGNAISDFLLGDIPLNRACVLGPFGSVNLMNFIWTRGLRTIESKTWSVAKLLHNEPHYARWEFTQTMVQAVRRGDLKIILWLLNRFPDCPIYEEVLSETCNLGQLETLLLLDRMKTDNDLRWGDLLLDKAAESGHWELIHWVHTHLPDRKQQRQKKARLFKFAFRDNNLNEMKWLLANDYEVHIESTCPTYSEETWPSCKQTVRYLFDNVPDNRALENIIEAALQTASEAGDFEFVEWLTSCRLSEPESAYNFSLECACKRGHIQVVQCLLTRMATLELPNGPTDAMFVAARCGQLELVQYLYEQYGRNDQINPFQVPTTTYYRNASCTTEMDAAAQNGHLQVIQFLHRLNLSLRKKRKKKTSSINLPQCTVMAMDAAAEAGHLEVVKWLHANRTEGCTVAAMDLAAGNGHLEVVKWLHLKRSEGCTVAAMNNVAARNYHKPDCPQTYSTCCADKRPLSFEENQIEILEWLKTNRTEGCTSRAMDMAARSRNLTVMKWLQASMGACPTTYAMDFAAKDGQLDIVTWLGKMFINSCSASAMDNAAGNGHLDVVQWLHSNRSENRPFTALALAACSNRSSETRRQLEVVRYLLANSTGIDVSLAMAQALHGMNFEIVLLLHTHHPCATNDNIRKAKNSLDNNAGLHTVACEVREWLEENYPGV